MADTEEPIWGDELEDYMDLGQGGAESNVKVTNLLSWESGDDQVTYEPSYIDVKVAPTYVLANKGSIEYEKDAYRNNALDSWLIAHEDETNIPVKVTRVFTWDGEKTAQKAKQALFLLTPKQLDKNSQGEPLKLKGTLAMKDASWTHGTFDSATKKFTQA
ncbi:hypothetical protein [Slackia exigua]|uniref:hypothetical protein n=1 Tax=Slackia exigua TaxID=84109 RepID=UPI0023F0D446|nr:hypothetical protein [Slackia exigua]